MKGWWIKLYHSGNFLSLVIFLLLDLSFFFISLSLSFFSWLFSFFFSFLYFSLLPPLLIFLVCFFHSCLLFCFRLFFFVCFFLSFYQIFPHLYLSINLFYFLQFLKSRHPSIITPIPQLSFACIERKQMSTLFSCLSSISFKCSTQLWRFLLQWAYVSFAFHSRDDTHFIKITFNQYRFSFFQSITSFLFSLVSFDYSWSLFST